MNALQFKAGDIIEVCAPDGGGKIDAFRATVIRETSDTHLKIRVDDGLVFVVAKEFCSVVSQNGGA